MEKIPPSGDEDKSVTCRICRCTRDKPCPPIGCIWIRRQPAALCSACVFFLACVRSDEIRRAVCTAAAIPYVTRGEAVALLKSIETVFPFMLINAAAASIFE